MIQNLKAFKSELPKAILFDADGTLYDSSKIHYLAFKDTLKNLTGYELMWQEFRDEILEGTKVSHEFIASKGLVLDFDRFIDMRLDKYKKLATNMLKPTAGVVDFLSHCKSSNLKCMIVSDGKLANIDSSLDILGIKHLFDGIISHENVDGKKKPSAHPYNLAISSLRNISPQNMIAFEDTAKGITSAKAAGLKCVAILHSSNKKTDLVDADMVISNFNEMQYLFN